MGVLTFITAIGFLMIEARQGTSSGGDADGGGRPRVILRYLAATFVR